MSPRLYILAVMILCAVCARPQAAYAQPDSLTRLYDEGKAYLARNDYNSALKRLLEYISAEERRKSHDTARLTDAYYNIGGVYSVYSDFAQALEIYKKGYALSLAAGDEKMQFRFLNNMIGASCDINATSNADHLNEKVKSLKSIDKGLRAYYYNFNKGFIAGSRGDDSSKATYMNKAIKTVDRYRLPGNMKVYAYSELYQCYENQGRLADALAALAAYDSLARMMDQAYLRADCYKGLMRIYTKLGDKEKALHYQNEYFHYADSLINIREFSQIRTNYLTGEKRRTADTISNLEKMNSLQRTVLAMLCLLVVLAVSAVIVFYRQRQKLHATNVELYKRNGELLEIEDKYLKSLEQASAESEGTGHDDAGDRPAAPFNHDGLMKKIMAVMEDEEVFCNPDFSLPVLARLTESNTNYVSQAINTHSGKNFRSFVNGYRIKLAMKRMMDNGIYANYTIKGIAESVGYKSASNFISAFKKFTGMTPSLYQKLSQND